jgi:glycogen synthase kinase 3 beta
MEELNHPNAIYTKHAFHLPAEKPNDVYLCLVMEYIPDTAYRLIRGLHREGRSMPMTLVKLYSY